MLALYIILGIFLFFFILMIFPVKVQVGYGEKIDIIIKYLFVKINLSKEKTEEEKQEEPEEEPEDEKNDEEKENPIKKFIKYIKDIGVKDFLSIIKHLLKLVLKFAVSVVRHIRIEMLDIYFVAGGDSVSSIAELYGKACCAIYPFVATLTKIAKCKKYGVTVDANYESKENCIKAELICSIRPIHVVPKAVGLCFKALPSLLKLKPKKERVKQ